MHSKTGLTLIEILFAMFILMFGLFAVMSMFLAELNLARTAESNYQLLNVVESSVIYLSSSGASWPYAYKADDTARTTAVAGECPYQQMDAYNDPKYFWKFRTTTPPGLAGVYYVEILLYRYYDDDWSSLSETERAKAHVKSCYTYISASK